MDTQPLSVQGVEDNQIAVLIGSDYYWDLVTGTVKPVRGKLKAVVTNLGWTVQDPLPVAADVIQCASAVVLRSSVEHGVVSKLFPHFWDVEGIRAKTRDGRVTDSDSVLPKSERNAPIKVNRTSAEAHQPLSKVNGVPFRATTTPVLITATLKPGIQSGENRYLWADRLSQDSMCMNHPLIGADTNEETIQKKKERSILQEASMNFCEPASNDPVVDAALEQGMSPPEKPLCSYPGTLKVLRPRCNKQLDTSSFKKQGIGHVIVEHQCTIEASKPTVNLLERVSPTSSQWRKRAEKKVKLKTEDFIPSPK